jgi:catechol 1,2-dioxygenase
MKHQDIEKLAKNYIVDTAQGEVNKRVQEITLRLLSDLMKAIEDLDISQSEFWTGVDYLSRTGALGEMPLLIPGLGLERFLDIRADEADERAGLLGGTPRTIEGPLYVAGAPVCQGFARLDDGTEEAAGEILFMEGTVFDHAGKPVPNATVEVWHANLKGGYSIYDSTQTPFNLRRTIVTDAQGKYAFRSIVPSGYCCPPEGQTQKLLNLLGRHGNRPAHIHFFVSAEGSAKLTTQINIDGDPYLWDDFAFASREGLVPAVAKISDEAEQKKRGVNRPFSLIHFDFQLRAAEAAATAEVERPRRAA